MTPCQEGGALGMNRCWRGEFTWKCVVKAGVSWIRVSFVIDDGVP